MENNKYLVPLAVVVAGAMIAGAIYMGGKMPSAPSQPAPTEEKQQIEVAPITDRDHIIGDKNAEIVVIEYSDFECPFCKVFHSTMQSIVADYEGKVAWVYRHYPIVQLHSKAPKESEASECAWELGGNEAFWKFINRLLETTSSNNSLDPAELPKIAEFTGVNVTSFNTCLSSGRYTSYIDESVAAAVKAGALGTPYSVIISKSGQQAIINGAEPIEMVKAKIDSLIQN
jgi:protein-disulfide isomerase